MAAKMLAMGHDVLYHENVEGGHAGAADNAERAHHWALVFRFLWAALDDACSGRSVRGIQWETCRAPGRP